MEANDFNPIIAPLMLMRWCVSSKDFVCSLSLQSSSMFFQTFALSPKSVRVTLVQKCHFCNHTNKHLQPVNFTHPKQSTP